MASKRSAPNSKVIMVAAPKPERAPSGLEEGRKDIFVLKSIFWDAGAPTPPAFGLFQYYRGRDDSTYILRTPVRFQFPADAFDLGALVAMNWKQITEDAGTFFLNFGKRDYFPDMHIGGVPEACWTTYENLSNEEHKRYLCGYVNKVKDMKSHR